MFLNQILMQPVFQDDQYVQGLVGEVDSGRWSRLVKQADSVQQVLHPAQMQTSSGQVDGCINVDSNRFYQAVNQYATLSHPIYTDLKKSFKQLMVNMANLQDSYYQIGNKFNNLQKITSQINNSIDAQALNDLKEMYKKLRNQMNYMGSQLEEQLVSTQSQLYTPTKYNCQQLKSFESLLETRDQYAQRYKKQYLLTKSRKEKLLGNNEVNSYDIDPQAFKLYSQDQLFKDQQLCYKYMCHTENKVTEELKEYFAFYEAQVYSEMNRHIKQKINNMGEHFRHYSNSIINTSRSITTEFNLNQIITN